MGSSGILRPDCTLDYKACGGGNRTESRGLSSEGQTWVNGPWWVDSAEKMRATLFSRAAVLSLGDCASPQPLGDTVNVWRHFECRLRSPWWWCYWNPLSRGQRCCSSSYNAQKGHLQQRFIYPECQQYRGWETCSGEAWGSPWEISFFHHWLGFD